MRRPASGTRCGPPWRPAPKCSRSRAVSCAPGPSAPSVNWTGSAASWPRSARSRRGRPLPVHHGSLAACHRHSAKQGSTRRPDLRDGRAGASLRATSGPSCAETQTARPGGTSAAAAARSSSAPTGWPAERLTQACPNRNRKSANAAPSTRVYRVISIVPSMSLAFDKGQKEVSEPVPLPAMCQWQALRCRGHEKQCKSNADTCIQRKMILARALRHGKTRSGPMSVR